MDPERLAELATRLAGPIHPDGAEFYPKLPTDKPWRDLVEARLREGLEQIDLADWIGTSQSAISQMLKRPDQRTWVVTPVSIALGIDLPMVARMELFMKQLDEAQDLAGMTSLVDLAASRVRDVQGQTTPPSSEKPKT